MFKIAYDKKITMVQGDTGVIRMRISNYELSQGDEVRFAIVNKANPSILLCQHSDKKIVLEKQVTVFEKDGSARIVIYPYDTEYLQPGKYLYEIQVKTKDGRIDTVVPLTSFTLMDGSIQGEFGQTTPSKPEPTPSEIELRFKRLENEIIPELGNRISNVENEIDSISSSLDNMENNQNVLTNFILGKQLLNGHGTKIGINNTIQAYEFLANTKCYDMLEADVHCTIDGVWVCTHDDDISINTNGIGLISQMTFETTQIADVVKRGNNINKFPKMKIPKLEDFINICLQYSLVPMIEIKCSMTNEKYNSLSTLIRRLGVENKVIITAFNQNVIQELRKMTNATLLWLIPSDRDISDSDITFAKNLGKCGLGGYQYKLTKPQIEKCKENNVFTYIWTITQQFELEIAKEMGGNIIGSDNVLRG